MFEKNTYKDFIRQENELAKLKIRAEFGIDLTNERELNPAIENIWLNHILKYERSMLSNTKITVEKLLENPTFTPLEMLSDEQVSKELHRLIEMLHAKNIVVDSESGIDDREMYRFITVDLFQTEVDSELPNNTITCFMYESFYPDDEKEIIDLCKDAFCFLTTGESSLLKNILKIPGDEEQANRMENCIRKLSLFSIAFDSIELMELTIISSNIEGELATVSLLYVLLVVLPGGKRKNRVSGFGKFNYLKTPFGWVIVEIQLDGIT